MPEIHAPLALGRLQNGILICCQPVKVVISSCDCLSLAHSGLVKALACATEFVQGLCKGFGCCRLYTLFYNHRITTSTIEPRRRMAFADCLQTIASWLTSHGRRWFRVK